MKSVDYTWEDQVAHYKMITFMIDGEKRKYEIEKIGKLKPIKTGRDVFNIELRATSYYREFVITSDNYMRKMNKKKNKRKNFLEGLMSRRCSRSEMEVKIYLEGIGISFVDSEPKEVLYFSIFKIALEYLKREETSDEGIENFTDINLRLYHIQIDN